MRIIFGLFLAVFSWIGFSAAFGAENYPPVSFQYDGVKIGPLTASDWHLESSESKTALSSAKFTERVLSYVTPDGRLEVRACVKDYADYPVWEYSLRLTNRSDAESTGLVQDFQSMERTSVPSASGSGDLTLRVLRGGFCAPDAFARREWTLRAGDSQTFGAPNGRSTEDCFAFIEMIQDDTRQIASVGWTGSWQAAVRRNESGETSLTAGMMKTSFKLLPKESIIQPSMTLFEPQRLSEREFKTLVHRFMIDCKVPRRSNGEIVPPIFATGSGGGNKTPEMMKSILDYCVKNQFTFNTYWIDAGWCGAPHETDNYTNCGPDWSRYVGDWRVNTVTHPTGDLKPIADAIHAAGMKFLLWFEPERVHESAPIAKEHPEYIQNHLLDYGNPEALAWIQDQVYGMIESHHIDIYRQDFNMSPRSAWDARDAETPDRVGIAEAKHIEGAYKFLDDMRTRFPWIELENCASGGQRLDIEMISRAQSYCRSDYFIGEREGDTAVIGAQNATLNSIPYLPFQGSETNGAAVGDDYAMMSFFSAGTVWTPSDFNGGILKRDFTDAETAWFKKMFAIQARMRTAYWGDFYQLTDEADAVDDCWAGWQAQEPSGDAGFALVFRRTKAPNESMTVRLGGIDADASYELEFFDGSKQIVLGKELENYEIKLAPRSFFLAFYKKI